MRRVPILLALFLAAACGGSSDDDKTTGRDTKMSRGDSGTVQPPLVQPLMLEAQAYLDATQPAPSARVHTFRTWADETVDCVAYAGQPSAPTDGMPSSAKLHPPGIRNGKSGAVTRGPILMGDLDQDGKPRACPSGTVPLRRDTAADIARAGGVQEWLRGGKVSQSSKDSVYAQSGHAGRHAWAVGVADVSSQGMSADVSVWEPYVTGTVQNFSLQQMWLSKLGNGTGKLQTLEAGFTVDYHKFSDWYPHLFTFWTADDYTTTGCINTKCSGIIVTNSGACLGCAIDPHSDAGQGQYYGDLRWRRSGSYWWLDWFGTNIAKIATSKFVGYGWASGQSLSNGANHLEVGGEICMPDVSYQPSYYDATDMGSGYYPSAGWGWAAWIDATRWLDSSATPHAVTLTPVATRAECYGAGVSGDSLLFGGIGGSGAGCNQYP